MFAAVGGVSASYRRAEMVLPSYEGLGSRADFMLGTSRPASYAV